MSFVLIQVGEKTFALTKIDENGMRWSIPEDLNNINYQEYLAWIDDGNTPEQIMA